MIILLTATGRKYHGRQSDPRHCAAVRRARDAGDMRFSLPPIADQAVLLLRRLASVTAYASTHGDRRQYREALDVRARGGAGIRAHAIHDGCWSFAVGQLDEDRAIPEAWMLRFDWRRPITSSAAFCGTSSRPAGVMLRRVCRLRRVM